MARAIGGKRRHRSCENDGMHLAPSDGPELPSGSSLLLTPWSSCARQEVDEGGRGGAEWGRQRSKSSFESRSGRVKELVPFFIFPRRGIAVAYFYKRMTETET